MAIKKRKKANKPADITAIFRNMLKVFREYYLSTMTILSVPIALFAASLIPVFLLRDSAANENPAWILLTLWMLVCYIMIGVAAIMTFKIYDSGWRDKPGFLGGLIKYGISRAIPVLGVMLVYFIVTAALMAPSYIASENKSVIFTVLSTIFYLVSFIYLWMRFGQAWLIEMLEPAVKNSFMESDRISTGQKIRILISSMLFMMILFAAELVIMLMAFIIMLIVPKSFTLLAVGPVFIIFCLVIVPLMNSFYYAMYRELRRNAR